MRAVLRGAGLMDDGMPGRHTGWRGVPPASSLQVGFHKTVLLGDCAWIKLVREVPGGETRSVSISHFLWLGLAEDSLFAKSL